ncbi:BEL1 homeodomain protein [Trifolium repens]|nr:BEL1 homeodomain protein [Trifolium repens]
MYPNQAFSSGSYAEMISGNTLLPHNYSESVGGQNELKFMTSMNDTMNMQHIDEGHSNDATSDPRTQFGLVESEQNVQCQGLSLSLGTMMPSFQYQYPGNSFTSLMNAQISNLKDSASFKDDEELRNAECIASLSSGGFHNTVKREGLYNPQHHSIGLNEGQSDPCLHGSAVIPNNSLNSHYLKAAQELLDEIVNVRKGLKQTGSEKQQSVRDAGLDGSKDSDGKSTSQSMQISPGPNGSNANNPSCELSPAERQHLLDKKTKLLAMLDEVDKRYRQYCHQMQIVVSSFDMVAGCGAAEPYTALALRTISRHFRCLRDAISGQIQVTQRSLGEQEGIPRLRYVDQQLRQQKALQQLGVMRQAWRPQRGLPESSVSILRAWLFEHFLHPYPKDSEKIMLARQTGLTRNQVANWFINARVRLWKPMVEEMYKEEFGDSETSSNLLSENTLKAPRDDDVRVWDDKREESQDKLTTIDTVQQGQIAGLKLDHASSSTTAATELDRGIQSNDHWTNMMDSRIGKMQGDQQRFNMNNSPYSNAPISINQNGDGCIMDSTTTTYDDLSELSNFGVGGHVSLALELRNSESDGFGLPNDDINKRRNQTLASSSDTDLLDYHFTDNGKQQHKFGNPHLLHEFVV